MNFEEKIPDWDNVGVEPDAQMKKDGFKAGYKPPAAYFNWFFNRISASVKELQEKAGNKIDDKLDASGGDISKTVVTTAEVCQAKYPVPAIGDSMGMILGKVQKFFTDIKRAAEPANVTLTASGWTGDAAPYSQTVEVEGVTSEDNPIFVSLLEDGAPAETQKAYMKAFGIIASGTGTTAAGSVTFKVYKKPETDIMIGLKGV